MKVLAIYVLSFQDSLFVTFVLLSPCIVRFGGFGMGGCWVLGGNCFLNWKNTARRETKSGLGALSLKRQFRTKSFTKYFRMDLVLTHHLLHHHNYVQGWPSRVEINFGI